MRLEGAVVHDELDVSVLLGFKEPLHVISESRKVIARIEAKLSGQEGVHLVPSKTEENVTVNRRDMKDAIELEVQVYDLPYDFHVFGDHGSRVQFVVPQSVEHRENEQNQVRAVAYPSWEENLHPRHIDVPICSLADHPLPCYLHHITHKSRKRKKLQKNSNRKY
jgi:hypothetical protein